MKNNKVINKKFIHYDDLSDETKKRIKKSEEDIKAGRVYTLEEIENELDK